MKKTKATNWKISQKFLNFRKPKNGEFQVPKWIQFCEHFIDKEDVVLYLYEARKTSSKYISIKYKNQQYRVRFSDHKPIKSREAMMDCDFFVGITNFKITNTEMAIKATSQWLDNLR